MDTIYVATKDIAAAAENYAKNFDATVTGPVRDANFGVTRTAVRIGTSCLTLLDAGELSAVAADDPFVGNRREGVLGFRLAVEDFAAAEDYLKGKDIVLSVRGAGAGFAHWPHAGRQHQRRQSVPGSARLTADREARRARGGACRPRPFFSCRSSYPAEPHTLTTRRFLRPTWFHRSTPATGLRVFQDREDECQDDGLEDEQGRLRALASRGRWRQGPYRTDRENIRRTALRLLPSSEARR